MVMNKRLVTVVLTLIIVFTCSMYLNHKFPSQLDPLHKWKHLNRHLKCGFDDMFLEQVQNESISEFFTDLTAQPHVAGTKECLRIADYIQEKLQAFGLKTYTSEYVPFLSYPVKRSLSIVHPWQENLSLDEEPVEGDQFSHQKGVIPPYLAYVPSGNVTSEVVYANYGTTEDFKALSAFGVNVTGTIVIIRYRKIFRGDKVANAAKAGAVGAIIFSDPENEAASLKEEPYPKTRWLPASGVQRGSALPSLHGDPTSPGWASTSDSEHLDTSSPLLKSSLPAIPALPLSYGSAAQILKGLEGVDAPASWHGGMNLDKMKLGRGPLKVNLDIQMEMVQKKIRNVHSLIEGSVEKDRYVILGNHHDAWTFGAVDPNSGSAALLEVARVLGALVEIGWRPRRSILICSWDAEEMGLVGSTEWVEDNSAVLSQHAVAYVNVDSATNGGLSLVAGASAQLDFLLWEAATKVKDPVDPTLSLLETWLRAANESRGYFVAPIVNRLGGSGTDYSSFLHFLGIPSVNLIYAERNLSFPMYHTLYDNPNWFEKFGDPHFQRVKAVSQISGLLAIWLADREIIPFNYVTVAEDILKEALKAKKIYEDFKQTSSVGGISFEPLLSALKKLKDSAEFVESEKSELLSLPRGNFLSLSPQSTDLKLRSLNDRLILAERFFLSPKGLKNRPWYRHLIYAPMRDNNYGSQPLPDLSDTLKDAMAGIGEWGVFQHEVYKVARAITQVASVLRGTL